MARQEAPLKIRRQRTLRQREEMLQSPRSEFGSSAGRLCAFHESWHDFSLPGSGGSVCLSCDSVFLYPMGGTGTSFRAALRAGRGMGYPWRRKDFSLQGVYMPLLTLQNVSLSLGGKELLEHADFGVSQGERVCLVGRNGVGKSSLLSLMAGAISPDDGQVTYEQGCRFGYMPQDVPTQWSGPVFCVAASGMGEEGRKLAAAHLASSGRGEKLPAEERKRAEEYLESGEGWERYGDVLAVVNSLSLDPKADFSTLSGGSKRRVALARALLASNDLLLDEPTNHLDIKTITWLEDFLIKRARTLVFISHDRAFARDLATRVVEIDRCHLYSYDRGFDDYLPRRDLRLENEEKENAAFDKKLAQEEIWIRKGIKARRTRNMGRVRDLIAMREERAQRRKRIGSVHMEAQEAEKSGKLVMEAVNLGFTYPDGYEVFHDFSAIIQRGDRIGIIGDNGTGKTTLLRVLLGELQPTSGTLKRGTNLEISYFDQLRETLDPNATIMDSVANGSDVVTINGKKRHVAGYLTDFLFAPGRLRVPVHTLSGGEKNRLLLARLFTKPSNLLVMDEPTNDLDMETLELLEELLAEYTGTAIMVSHDRAFLDDLATSTFALEGDRLIHEYVGGYTDWLRQRPEPKEKTQKAPRPQPKPDAAKGRKLTFKEQREQKMLQEELDGMPARSEALEKEQAELEQRLADPDLFQRDPDLFNATTKRMPELEQEQNALLERWEAVEARLKELADITKKV